MPQIEVTFDIDANGIVNVSAKDLGTGKEQHITITASSNMSESDIDKAVKEAAEFEAQDKKRKEGVDARNDADAIVFQTEKAIQEVGDKLDPTLKAKVEEDLKALKEKVEAYQNVEELSDSQIQELKDGRDALLNSSQALFAKMYEQANPQGGAQDYGSQTTGGQTSSGPDDDVVDADFKEV